MSKFKQLVGDALSETYADMIVNEFHDQLHARLLDEFKVYKTLDDEPVSSDIDLSVMGLVAVHIEENYDLEIKDFEDIDRMATPNSAALVLTTILRNHGVTYQEVSDKGVREITVVSPETKKQLTVALTSHTLSEDMPQPDLLWGHSCDGTEDHWGEALGDIVDKLLFFTKESV